MTDLQTTFESIPGFRAAGVACGLKKNGRPDLALIAADAPCAAAGVFTTNYVKAAPVLLDQERLAANASGIRALAINAGVANACTGAQGLQDAEQTAAAVAGEIGCAPGDVLVMSTGVIGAPLPMDKLQQGVKAAAAALRPDGWPDAAQAIMTTDTRPKMAAVQVQSNGGSYTVAGIAKGAGMIAPNMATMLCAVVTDAALEPSALQTALIAAATASFNQIVVDGDMSTNDTVLLLANGVSGVRIEADEALWAFRDTLRQVCVSLAKAIVHDAEGATRFITVRVTGAPDVRSARRVANTIATSPLVKTAFYGGDANWGRILAAAGRANVPLETDRLALWFAPGEEGQDDGLQIVAGGAPTDYAEAAATDIVQQPAVRVRLDLGLGSAEATVWTCDLSHEYVNINGSYRS